MLYIDTVIRKYCKINLIELVNNFKNVLLFSELSLHGAIFLLTTPLLYVDNSL